MARSSVYATAPPRGAAPPRGKRGPKTAVSDADLVAAIRRSWRDAIPRRGLPEGAGAAGAPRCGRRRQARPAADAPASAAGAAPAGPTERRIPPTPGRSSPRGPTRCGAPTRRGSTPSRTAGAGSSERSITTATTSSAGTWRSSAIAGPRLNPFARACASLRGLRQRRRARAPHALRLGPAVHRRRLDQRGEVARHSRSRHRTSASRSATASSNASCGR